MLVGVFHFDSQLRSAYPGVGATLSPWVLRLEQGLCFPYAVAGLGRGNQGSACHCRETRACCAGRAALNSLNSLGERLSGSE